MAQWQQACYFLVGCDHHVCQACLLVLNGLVCECQTSQGNPVNEASAKSSFNTSPLIQQHILGFWKNTGLGSTNKPACVSVSVTCSRCLEKVTDDTAVYWADPESKAWPLCGIFFPYELIKILHCMFFYWKSRQLYQLNKSTYKAQF